MKNVRPDKTVDITQELLLKWAAGTSPPVGGTMLRVHSEKKPALQILGKGHWRLETSAQTCEPLQLGVKWGFGKTWTLPLNSFEEGVLGEGKSGGISDLTSTGSKLQN